MKRHCNVHGSAHTSGRPVKKLGLRDLLHSAQKDAKELVGTAAKQLFDDV